MLKGAGAREVSEKLVEFVIKGPLTPREFWEVRSELSDTLRAKLATLSAEQLRDLARDVEQAASAFFVEGQMKFPAQVLIVTGSAKS
jgi:hypothetical protein